MKKNIYLIILILISSCSSIKTKKVTSIDPTTNSEGFYYFLPKAKLIATFEIEKSEYKEGIYEKYAANFGIEVKKPTSPTSYVIKKTTLETKAVPDNTQIYLADISKNFLNKSEFSFEYATDGQLTSGDISKESQILPLVTTIVNTAGAIIGKEEMFINESETNKNAPNNKNSKKLYEEAKKINEKIITIDSYINNLYSEISTNSEAFKTQLETLQNEKKRLLTTFTGTTTIKSSNLSFEIEPPKKEKSINLFSINDKGIKLHYKTSDKIDSSYTTISISFDTKSIYGDRTKEDSTSLTGSFFYRIPANAKFSINQLKNYKSTKIKSFELTIPQFGIAVASPKNLNKINFSLHPDTGALKTVSGTSNTIDIEAYEALRDAGIDFKNSIKPTDERDKLIESLEKDLRIKELQESLGIKPSTDGGE